jgi:hypothetical protein
MKKVCTKCKVEKPLDEDNFHRDKRSKDGWSPRCKLCKRETHKAWRDRPGNYEKTKEYQERYYAKNPDKPLQYDRQTKLRRKYGIDIKEYERLEAEQGGRCAICKELPSDPRGYRLHVDHCHATGKVRGLLCTSCNSGLGRFKDSVERLESAVKYLEQAGLNVYMQRHGILPEVAYAALT